MDDRILLGFPTGSLLKIENGGHHLLFDFWIAFTLTRFWTDCIVLKGHVFPHLHSILLSSL